MQATIAIKDNSLVFTTGLFRCNEFIRLQAIAEAPIDAAAGGKKNVTIEDRLDNAISITHRIADTQKVRKLELPNKRLSKHRVSRYFAMAIVATVIITALCGLFLWGGVPAETHFVVNDTNGVPHEVKATPRLNGSVTLKGVGDGFRQQITLDEFWRMQPIKPRVVFPSELKFMSGVVLLYVIGPWAMCGFAYREQRRANKLRLLLGIEEHKENPGVKSAVP